MFVILTSLYEHAIHNTIASPIHILLSLQLYEHAIHPNKGSHTYVCYPYIAV